MYTLKEVAEKMEVSEHTLRFWAKSGFFPFIKRNEHNIRLFSDDDLGWVRTVKCLRSVGTENKAIKRYGWRFYYSRTLWNYSSNKN